MTEELKKITIDDQEYNLADFSEEAIKVLKEVVNINNLVSSKEQEVSYLKITSQVAMTNLKESNKDVKPIGNTAD
jgi:hypothetical protein